MFERLIEEIKRHEAIIIHRHSKPDGDAMGSQIGLKNLIRDNFPNKNVYVVGDVSGRFTFMEDSKMDTIPDSAYENALAIVLDTSASALISDDRYKQAKMTARVDHHIFCEKICELEITDTSYESCCGLITEFALESGLTISPLAAKSLYTGMVTDSGRFRYDSTTSNTFRLASELMKHGIDTNEIFTNLYADDFENVKKRAYFILKIKFTENKVAYIYTDKDEAASLGMDIFSISRGMVGTMSDLRGVDIWVNFTEDGDNVLCELRSSKYNINPIAVKYGGGGHAKASGATVASRDVAMQMLADLDNMIKENKK